MRRSSPQAGFICRLCASTPARTWRQPHFPQAITPTPRRITKSPTWQTARRWASTASPSTEYPSTASPSTASPSDRPEAGVVARTIAPEPHQLASVAEDSSNKFLSVDGIPAQALTSAALSSCLRAASALHPHLKRAEAQSKASASKLVELGAERTGTRLAIDGGLLEASRRISRSAYAIISHANVEMTPEFLELYVQIQAQLGRPESLPAVLELYATKPRPVVRRGQIAYAPQSRNAVSRAVEPAVAELALQTAIDARHLDAALGVVEAAYCVPAFRRHKLLKHASAPAMALASLPFGIMGLSTAYAAYWQNTMDVTTATGIAVAGISGYFFVVGSLGLIAKLSNKDQMRRVTWTPGTPLRYRWLREEERAALDKVACAWGFREPWRHGEETGAEWEGLKEYMGYRQMLLDRVEFMEGMN